ncbi:MAG TPA: MFS transporter, partial [Stellaceae bacterium]|nr:MFS transporter [Stellaceae bacterium]
MAAPPKLRFAVALAAVTLISPLAVHLYLPLLPDIRLTFGVSAALAELSFTITLATMAVATLVYGSLSDRFGRRPVLLSGLALFLAGSVVSALAPSIEALIAGRLVQAVGAACGTTITRTMARDAYGADRLVKAIAYLTMAYTLGPMVAPPVGGYIDDRFGWRGVFGFALLASSVIAAAAFFVLHETKGRGETRRGGGVWHDYWSLFANVRFSAFVLQSG